LSQAQLLGSVNDILVAPSKNRAERRKILLHQGALLPIAHVTAAHSGEELGVLPNLAMGAAHEVVHTEPARKKHLIVEVCLLLNWSWGCIQGLIICLL